MIFKDASTQEGSARDTENSHFPWNFSPLQAVIPDSAGGRSSSPGLGSTLSHFFPRFFVILDFIQP